MLQSDPMMSQKQKKEPIYKVIFFNQGKIYEIFARSVSQGDLFGFIMVEELLFGEKTQVVVDPGEESLKLEFEGVRKIHIPMHAVSRIDEVERRGKTKITTLTDTEGTVSTFPSPIYTPGDRSKNS
jgi:hypothetical protein